MGLLVTELGEELDYSIYWSEKIQSAKQIPGQNSQVNHWSVEIEALIVDMAVVLAVTAPVVVRGVHYTFPHLGLECPPHRKNSHFLSE